MINRFRNINTVNIVFLGIIAILLRLGIFFQLPDTLNFDFIEPFAKLLIAIPLQTDLPPIINVFIALCIIFIQALLFNRIINNYTLIGKPNLLPALLYITCSSLLLPFLVLSPALICNFLIIWIIEKFLGIYRRPEVSSVMFDIGMIIALGTLIYFPFIAMLPLLWISLLIFRPFNWRETMAGLVGFITIFFFLGVLYYWNDSLDKFYQIWLPLATRFPTNIRINFYDYLVLIPVIIVLMLAVLQLRGNFFRSFVQVRKSFQLLFFMFLLAILSFYLKTDFHIYHFLLAVPSASVFMAYYFMHARKPWFYEMLYLILVSFIVYFQWI